MKATLKAILLASLALGFLSSCCRGGRCGDGAKGRGAPGGSTRRHGHLACPGRGVAEEGCRGGSGAARGVWFGVQRAVRTGPVGGV